jgi:hypothetical protein
MRTIFYVSILFSLLLIFLAYNPAIMEGQPSVGNPLLGLDEGTGEGGEFDFVTFLGGLVVFIFYFMKFGRWPGPENTPPGFRPKPTRHFTTWLRYVGWAVVYGSFMLFCYMMIVFFPKLFVNFLEAYIGIGVGVPDADLIQRILAGLKGSPENMVPYAVIIVTVVWSGAFAEAERTFRRNLQESALIPTEANRLIEHYEMHPEAFGPKMDHARRVIRESPFKLIAEANFTDESEGTLEFRFAQCEYILDQISRLRSKRYFAHVLTRYQEDFDEAKIELNKLRGKLQGYKNELLETLRSPDSAPLRQENLNLSEANRIWEKSHEPLPFERRYFGKMWDQLENDALDCLRAVLRIVICLVLAIGRSPYQRNALLKKFGLKAPDNIGPVFNREYTVRAGVVVVLTMILCSGVYYATSLMGEGQNANCPQIAIPIPQSVAEIAVWTVYTAILHLLGIAGGYSIQKWLTEEHRQFEDADPQQLKLSDCATCFVFGFCLNIFFFALVIFPRGQWQAFQVNWPWALVAAVTASFAGYYMTRSSRLKQQDRLARDQTTAAEADGDKKQDNQRKDIDYRIMLLQGVVTAFFAGGVMLYIYDIDFIMSAGECPAMTAYAIYVFATTMLIGAALSYILQDWITADRNNGRGKPNTPPPAMASS